MQGLMKVETGIANLSPCFSIPLCNIQLDFPSVGTFVDPRFVDNRTMNMIYRVNRNLRFYEDSGFAWQERFVK